MTGQVGPLSPGEATFAEVFLDADLGAVRAHYDAIVVPGLIIGMAPGPRTSSRLPMFPWPEGSAGGRLLAMSGMPVAAYLGRLCRINLCDGPFRPVEAQLRASRLVAAYRVPRDGGPSPRFVLCGRDVAGAFGLLESGWFDRLDLGGLEVAVVPHPSGRCREYNDPAAVARARDAVRWAARWEGE